MSLTSSFVNAEGVVMDEAAILEAALAEVMGRRNGALQGRDLKVGKDVEEYAGVAAEDVSTYGAQLKAWVDMQVDARLEVVLRAQLDTYMLGVHHDLEAVRDMQAKQFAVLESLSEEPARIKAAMKHLALVEEANTALCKEVTSLRPAIDECQSIAKLNMAAMKECESAIKSNAAEMRQVEMDESRLKRQMEESQDRLREEILARQHRSFSDLRNEMTLAIQNEATAIAALDKRFYVLDQRVSQRIEELALKGEEHMSPSTSLRSIERVVNPDSPEWSFCGGRVIRSKTAETLSQRSTRLQQQRGLSAKPTILISPQPGESIQIKDRVHIQQESSAPIALGEEPFKIRSREPCSGPFWKVDVTEQESSVGNVP